MSFELTYTMEQGPPALAWDEYAAGTEADWRTLLAEAPTEAELQAFLEKHPALLPGAWTPSGGSGHVPLNCAVVTQPVLPGLNARRPDFMWIATHSSAWYPTLIEIESPEKRIFTVGQVPRAEFTQARNQLAQWRTWFSFPANVQQFVDSYGIPAEMTRGRHMHLHMILIYGRRAEFENDPHLSRQRGALLPGADEELMSFDRLSMDKELAPALTVRASGSGQYEVVSVPPVLELGPLLADRFTRMHGFAEAIERTPVSDDRKRFLLRRIGYWREWAGSQGSQIYRPADWE